MFMFFNSPIRYNNTPTVYLSRGRDNDVHGRVFVSELITMLFTSTFTCLSPLCMKYLWEEHILINLSILISLCKRLYSCTCKRSVWVSSHNNLITMQGWFQICQKWRAGFLFPSETILILEYEMSKRPSRSRRFLSEEEQPHLISPFNLCADNDFN